MFDILKCIGIRTNLISFTLIQFALFSIVLPCSSKRAMPDQLPYQKSKFWYENPQHPRTKYFNQILPGMFEARFHMSESGFESYLFKERSKRWEIKNKKEKVERKLNYMSSDDNNACFGKYLNPLSHVSPSDILNCERGVKELSSLEEEVLKEKLSAEESYGELFTDNGQIHVWAKEKKEYLESLIGELISLIDTIKDAKSKICVYLSPSYKALTQLNTSRRKASLVSRRKKENDRKSRNRKRKRMESAKLAHYFGCRKTGALGEPRLLCHGCPSKNRAHFGQVVCIESYIFGKVIDYTNYDLMVNTNVITMQNIILFQ